MANNIPEYFTALLPESYIIGGLQLEPFSIGHYIILSRYNSPFVSCEQEISTAGDLLFAIAVCCRTFEQAISFVRNEEEAKLWMEEYAAKIVSECEKENVVIDWQAKMVDFMFYIKEHLNKPTVIDRNHGITSTEQPSGMNFHQSLIITLTSKGGYTYSQTMNAPYSQALFDYYAVAEKEGAVRFANEDEKLLLELAKG